MSNVNFWKQKIEETKKEMIHIKYVLSHKKREHGIGLTNEEEERYKQLQKVLEGYFFCLNEANKEENNISALVMEHARKNYIKGGWDILYETMGEKEIKEELEKENISSFDDAIVYYKELYGIIDDYRKEIQAS